jgi:hypothetical protein
MLLALVCPSDPRFASVKSWTIVKCMVLLLYWNLSHCCGVPDLDESCAPIFSWLVLICYCLESFHCVHLIIHLRLCSSTTSATKVFGFWNLDLLMLCVKVFQFLLIDCFLEVNDQDSVFQFICSYPSYLREIHSCSLHSVGFCGEKDVNWLKAASEVPILESHGDSFWWGLGVSKSSSEDLGGVNKILIRRVWLGMIKSSPGELMQF